MDELKASALSRRSALKIGAASALFLTEAAALERSVITPQRAAAATATFSDIQYDIGQFINPAFIANDGAGNVQVQFGPVFALFLPVKLTRTPTKADQAALARALATIEDSFPASPAGLFIASVSYGLPYFSRLPQQLVAQHMPHLLSNPNRFALEEAAPTATDVVDGLVGGPNAPLPGVTKDRFNVNVVIESNDMLFQLRSDSMANLASVPLWLQGSNLLGGQRVASPDLRGLLRFGEQRVQFVQPGMPRRVADQNGFEFAGRINPDSSMTMGFVDQQVAAAGPAAITTFAGNASATLTDASPGDYFDNGSIAHFSHVIEDLYQFYATPNQDPRHSDGEPFTERCQYAFDSNQLGTTNGIPAAGNADQYTDGGGPAYINNVFQGPDAVVHSAADTAGTFGPGNQSLDATFTGEGRIGHNAALQRVSRAADGTPLHIRNDGPGFDSMDVPSFQLFPGQQTVPAGSRQFKLQFLIFMPTADVFARMRTAQAAQDLLVSNPGVDPDDNGFERFITATRRQNFLVPPRRNRAFPLVELT